MQTFAERVSDAARTGAWVDLTAAGEPAEAVEHARWGSARDVPAAELAEALASLDETAVAVRIRGARIVGDLDLCHRRFPFSVFIERCAFLGALELMEAELPSLWVTDSFFAKGVAAEYLTVDRAVQFSACVIEEPVNLSFMRAGAFSLTGSTLSAEDGEAFTAYGAVIGGNVVLDGVTANGAVRFGSARIGGSLGADGAKLSHPVDDALDLQDCEVERDVLLRDGFRADGDVDLLSASIGDRLELHACEVTGAINALDASVSVLHDDPRCWPEGSVITRFRYDSLVSDNDADHRDRLAWLTRLLGDYRPQPYTRLAAAYRAAGNDTAVRHVLIAKQRARRRAYRHPVRRFISPVWSAFLRWTIGYGYAPWRAFAWVGGLLATAYLVFATAPPGAVTSIDAGGEPFRPFLYALETLVPLVKVGGAQWTAHGGYVWWHTAFSIVGWLFASIIAAGVAGVFKRD